MKYFLFRLVLGTILFVIAVPAQSQECAHVLRGYVYEAETNAPLPYATVYVEALQRGTMTDENGFFSIPDLCMNSRYKLEFKHVECVHLTQEIDLDNRQQYDFFLQHAHVLDEVQIRAQALRPTAVEAESTVDERDLDATKNINLGAALKTLPGVNTLNTGSSVSKPIIHGLHSNRIAIVNNSVPLEGQQWGSEHAPEIDPNTAGSLRVVKGAAAVRYGVGAMAGAVVLERAALRQKKGWGGTLTTGGFSNGRQLYLSGSTDFKPEDSPWTFRLQGSWKRGGNLHTPDYFMQNTGLHEGNASFLAQRSGTRWQHEIFASTFNQKLGVLRAAHVGNLSDLQLAIASPLPRNNTDAFSYAVERPFQHVEHQTAWVKSTLRINPTWKLSAQYAFQYNHRSEYDVVRSSNNDSPQLAFQLWTNMLDLSLEHFPIRNWSGGIGVQALHQLNFVSRGGFIPDFQSAGGSLWAMERWRTFSVPWEFEIGGRYDYKQSHATTSGTLNDLDQTVDFGTLAGSVGLLYRYGSHGRISVHSGLAVRPPSINELFARGVHFASASYEEGNAALVPEQAWNNSLSVEFTGEPIQFSFQFYHNQIRDFIFLEPQAEPVLTVRGAFPAYQYTQSDAIMQGIDAQCKLPLPADLFISSKASILRGKYLLAGTDAYDWLPLLPSDRFEIGLGWDHKTASKNEWFVKLSASHISQQTRYQETGLLADPPPGYTLLALQSTYAFEAFEQSFQIGLDVMNLTNTAYRDYLNFFRYFSDEPGRNVGLRVQWKFS